MSQATASPCFTMAAVRVTPWLRWTAWTSATVSTPTHEAELAIPNWSSRPRRKAGIRPFTASAGTPCETPRCVAF